jgi:hypothetical protein
MLSSRRSKLRKHLRESSQFLDVAAAFRLCSYAMSELVSTPAIKSASSFSSLLESFTGSAKNSNGIWDDSALLEDVATISYEQALRSHRRVLPVEALPADESLSAVGLATERSFSGVPGKKKKSASITIRLTESEEAQLHQRAAAAQLSVSAYLRSCIFEAELLRSQVKQALSQMKAATALSPHASDEPQSKPASGWRTRFFSRWSQARDSA